MSIANLFEGLSHGFDTFLALKQAQDEQGYRRHREGLEDEARAQYLKLAQGKEASDRAQQDLENRRYSENTQLQALKDAGVVGGTPQMLEQARDSNQTQSGAGAGVGGQNLVQNAMRSLSVAQQSPGYDPRKGSDLGGGLRYQGPEYEKPETDHYSMAPGEDNEFIRLNTKSGQLSHTGFKARAPITGSAMDPRAYVVEHTPTGDFVVDKRNPTGSGTNVIDPNTQKRAQGAQTVPGETERSMDMLNTSIQPSIERVDKYFSKLQAPGVVSQALGKMGGEHGVVGGVANTVLGKVDPDYQAILPDITGIYRAYATAIHGKRLSETTVHDVAKQYFPSAGDSPETLKEKLRKIHIMSAALESASHRAQVFRESGGTGEVPDASSTAPATDLKKKYGLE